MPKWHLSYNTQAIILGAGMFTNQQIPIFGERNRKATILFGQPEGNHRLPLRL